MEADFVLGAYRAPNQRFLKNEAYRSKWFRLLYLMSITQKFFLINREVLTNCGAAKKIFFDQKFFPYQIINENQGQNFLNKSSMKLKAHYFSSTTGPSKVPKTALNLSDELTRVHKPQKTS